MFKHFIYVLKCLFDIPSGPCFRSHLTSCKKSLSRAQSIILSTQNAQAQDVYLQCRIAKSRWQGWRQGIETCPNQRCSNQNMPHLIEAVRLEEGVQASTFLGASLGSSATWLANPLQPEMPQQNSFRSWHSPQNQAANTEVECVVSADGSHGFWSWPWNRVVELQHSRTLQ